MRALALGWKNLAAYPPEHPALVNTLQMIEQRLCELRGPAPEVVFGVAADGLMYGQEKIDSMYAQKFAHALYSRGVAVIHFENPSAEDMGTFLRLLGFGAPDAKAPLWEELTGSGVMSIQLQPVDYSSVELTDSLADEPARKESRSLWEEILRGLLAGRELTPHTRQLLTRGVKSMDELSALIMQYAAGEPDTAFDPNATFGVRFMAPVPDASQAPEAVIRRVSESISMHISGATGLKKQLAVQQVLQLLKSLPESIASVVMRGVMRALACDEGAGSLLREFVEETNPDEALHALSYLSTVSNLSTHATTLLQSLSLAGKPDTTSTELQEGVISDMADLFGDDDPDRFNPQDHRELLNEVAVHIPSLSSRMLSNIEVLGNRVDSVQDAEIDRLLSRTLIDLLMSLGASRDARPLLRRIEALFCSSLSAREFDDARETFERLQEIALSTTSDELRTALDTTFNELANAETTQTLIESLLHAKPEQSATIQKLVEIMGSPAARGLLLALAEEENRSRRRKLFDVVVAIGPVIVPEVSRFLSDSRWFVVRNMIALLRAVNDRTALAEVRKLAQHRDLRVRLEAIKTLIGPDSSLPIALLNDAINDPDPKLAETAITLVGNYGIKEGVAPLLKILSHMDIFGRKKALRILAIKALGELGVPTALPEMGKFFKDPFLPWPSIEERRAAFESLSSYPVEARAPFIELGLKSRDSRVRAICHKLSAG